VFYCWTRTRGSVRRTSDSLPCTYCRPPASLHTTQGRAVIAIRILKRHPTVLWVIFSFSGCLILYPAKSLRGPLDKRLGGLCILLLGPLSCLVVPISGWVGPVSGLMAPRSGLEALEKRKSFSPDGN